MPFTTLTPNLTAALVTALTLAAGSASAMDDMASMTCADFMAMSQEDQMMALEAMQGTHSDAMSAGDMASDATDSMSAEGAASSDMATDSMTDDMATGDTMATDDATDTTDAMAPDNAMAAVTAACDGHPDMMAADAMAAAAMAPPPSN